MSCDLPQNMTSLSEGPLLVPSSVECQLQRISAALAEVTPAPTAGFDVSLQNQLVAARLGLASGVFTSLRVRHKPTADHALRVALLTSAWSLATQMREQDRHVLEIAALLHDIGKISVPDAVLRKPSALTPEQSQLMGESRRHGLQILACFVPQTVLDAVAAVGSWYDGSRGLVRMKGENIPLSSRMITIVDAYDSMISDTVYRKGMPQERAIAELFAFSGTQFDPDLVDHFSEWYHQGAATINTEVSESWLMTLEEGASNQLWKLRLPQFDGSAQLAGRELFYQELLHGLHDAVFFLDGQGQVLEWSRGATQMTGIVSSAIEQRHWLPSLVQLRDASGRIIADDACPISAAVREGIPLRERMVLMGRGGELIDVETLTLPVGPGQGKNLGATVIFRDATNQATLEQRVRHLHERATRDPLTNVANRAEFDRFHRESVVQHLKQNVPCSLIICDIDRFKSINDKYGHQAGDQAIVSLAAILSRSCRSGDLVARYGGEEFVIVCGQCGIAEATELAEQIRAQLAKIPLRELGGQCITASFGVTEVQPGDTPETMLRRADRGLLQAKQSGRNCVVQLGSGMTKESGSSEKKGWWTQWLAPPASRPSEFLLATNVPINFAIEKLAGFISDHDANVLEAELMRISLSISSDCAQSQRRNSDRQQNFRVDVEFEDQSGKTSTGDGPSCITLIRVTISPTRTRDRRESHVELARQIMNSLRSYLMAQEVTAAAATAP